MKVAVLTGGGDCPGLNAVIRAIVRKGAAYGMEVMGVLDGWKGLLEDRHVRLTRDSVSGILHRGGTILGTSRTNPFKRPDGPERVERALERSNVGAVVAIGGEDTLGVAAKFHERGMHIVGVPKTIDNDLSGTDYTFGFDTAVQIATEAIDRLHTTAESHGRVMVCEVMGRHAGWIATYAGMAGGADVILIPEQPLNLDAVCASIQRRHDRGKKFSIVVVAEGVEVGGEGRPIDVDEFGHVRLGGIGAWLARHIEERTRLETRVTVLGHVQRGGTPTAHDRVLATRFGVFATELVQQGAWGKVAALRGNSVIAVDLAEAVRELKHIDPALYEVAATFFD